MSALSQADRYDAAQSDDGRYRLLVEGITDYAIYMLNPAGLVVSWNAGAQRIKGYRANEIIGRHFSTFYGAEDRQKGLPSRALEIAAAEGKFESEGWRIRKDGSRFWAFVIIDAIRTRDGELAGYAKITRDLTERRAAEQSLRASQEQFRHLVQGVTDYAIYMLTPSGEISTWNPGAARIKGYKAEEVIGTHFSRFYTPEDQATDEPARALATAREQGRYEKEGLRVRQDGTRFWANVVIDALREEDGTLIGFAKITRDITAQRESRQALEEARESLFQAQKMDAIGQLTGGVAHDFNNLLMVIMGSLEILRKRMPADARAMSLLDNAVAGARRGTALTQRMLAFARRQELSVETVDLPGLIKGMTELLERSLGATVELEMRFPLKLSAVQTDANQLELALLNLVVNARDAMPDGGTIVIAAREATVTNVPDGLAPGRYVCLSVTDAGEGMDAATLARATEPFFTTKGVGKGTGLGLPMVHGVAQQSGGRLVLKSEKGQGTRAELWLPRAMPAAIKAPDPAVEVPAPAKIGPLSVLLVDDDNLVLRSASAMLEDLGHRVLEASSGTQALTFTEDLPVLDLVITDHVMPGMSGAEFANILHARFPKLPIIIATGYAELPAGKADGFVKLSKPFSQGAVEAAVRSAMLRSNSA